MPRREIVPYRAGAPLRRVQTILDRAAPKVFRQRARVKGGRSNFAGAPDFSPATHLPPVVFGPGLRECQPEAKSQPDQAVEGPRACVFPSMQRARKWPLVSPSLSRTKQQRGDRAAESMTRSVALRWHSRAMLVAAACDVSCYIPYGCTGLTGRIARARRKSLESAWKLPELNRKSSHERYN
jgi:hypothetical protein